MTMSEDERRLLAAHHLALFEGRLIHRACAPIEDATLRAVEARVGRALPPGLIRLWRQAFGGALDYDMQVDYQGHLHAFSFSELFYPQSDGYHDLWGWIEHEQASARGWAEEDGRQWDGRLDFLPFGGFEYL